MDDGHDKTHLHGGFSEDLHPGRGDVLDFPGNEYGVNGDASWNGDSNGIQT